MEMEIRYFWLHLKRDVTKFIQQCQLSQEDNETTQNIGFYTPLPKPNAPIDGFHYQVPKTRRKMDSIFCYDQLFFENDSLHSLLAFERCKPNH